jgi:hypothetical protein
VLANSVLKYIVWVIILQIWFRVEIVQNRVQEKLETKVGSI